MCVAVLVTPPPNGRRQRADAFAQPQAAVGVPLWLPFRGRQRHYEKNNEGIEGTAWDDVSGKVLDKEMVHQARKEEIDEFHKHEVYTQTELAECWKETGKAPVKVRWIDINKGDSENPDYRSRLVAKEIKKDNRDDLFAATPPLEALRT